MKTNKSFTSKTSSKPRLIVSRPCKSPTTLTEKYEHTSDGAILFQQGYMRRRNIREILEKEGHDERNRQREEGSSC